MHQSTNRQCLPFYPVCFFEITGFELRNVLQNQVYVINHQVVEPPHFGHPNLIGRINPIGYGLVVHQRFSGFKGIIRHHVGHNRAKQAIRIQVAHGSIGAR